MQNQERISRAVFAAAAGLVIVIMLAIFLFVGLNAYQTFTVNHVSPASFFFGTIWSPDDGAVGALVLIIGSFAVTVLAVLISTPLSVAVALFVTEVAPPWARRFMQPVLELLTGIPSIIYGILGLVILVPLIAHLLNFFVEPFYTNGFGLLAAALVLTVMILPTITTISIDALGALPNGLREASLALGATRWQTIRKTLVPAASSGIFTGIILGMGRAIGETLAVSFVIGSNGSSFPIKFISAYPYIQIGPTSTLTVQMLFDFKEASPNTLNIHALWTLAFILLVVSFLLVVAGRWVASRGIYSERSSRPRRNFLRRVRPVAVAATPQVATVEGSAQ